MRSAGPGASGPKPAAAFSWVTLAISISAVSGCKPPPTDAEMGRDATEETPAYASDPLPSPETEGAVWARSPQNAQRIVYGVPGEPALMALTCLTDGELPRVQITRMSPADEGAGALMALIGNGHIGRMEVDAIVVAGRSVWQGTTLAANPALEPLAGPRQLTATIPGAGLVTLNPSPQPMAFLEDCRSR
ncbi:MAG: hypothetical protein AAF559_07910 [Pseudomonadota bacterium]